jgi:hypothetical protein
MTDRLRHSEGTIVLADAIKGNGALSVTNVMGNRIDKEQLTKTSRR